MDIWTESAELYHYGTKYHSGRYPYGSGDNPYQHDPHSIMSLYSDLKDSGLSETEIAAAMGYKSTSELRAQKSIASNEIRAERYTDILKYKAQGLNTSAIARKMGVNESTIRSTISSVEKGKTDASQKTAEALKKAVDSKQFIDVGTGTELYLGVSPDRLKTSLEILKAEGYVVKNIQVQQMGTAPGNKTTIKVLAKPGTESKDIYAAAKKSVIELPVEYHSVDNGQTFNTVKPFQSIDSNRIQICYAEDGGKDRDGVIQIRRGVDDLNLGNSNYAQVRILVNEDHYLKGMAMYSDDMPDGVDIIFNTNKHSGTSKMDVLKPASTQADIDKLMATVKANGQSYYIGKDGKEHLSAINKVNEEGDWGSWSKSLSSQMLSKQPLKLVQKQLNLAYQEKAESYNDILELTNPAIKKKLLMEFADECDSAAVHLRGAALPRQQSHVILPISDIKDTEVYAPNFKNGERVVLIRYPHGGIFEIPELTVNNNYPSAQKLIGKNSPDAIGINAHVAERLSGADFDGDTVLVIPNNNHAVKTSAALKGLEGFDPKDAYPYYEGMKVMDARTKQQEMGKVSNLITDMTLQGASPEKICRAVRHSMCVIDAEKHKLDWKRSERENDIPALKEEFQGKRNAGASSIISRASAEIRVPEKKAGVKIDGKTLYFDPNTGAKLYTETDRTYTDLKTGKEKKATSQTTRMADIIARQGDAKELVGNPNNQVEMAYADYANQLKALSNEARKQALYLEPTRYSPDAAKRYSEQVASLNDKLKEAKKNAPLERKAQIIANALVAAKRAGDPGLKDDPDRLKKVKARALNDGRARSGASKHLINVTDDEWAAIQAGAISNNRLTEILKNTDVDALKERAMPREKRGLTNTQISRIKSMQGRYSTAEIAQQLGVSTSTIQKYLLD